MDALLFCVCMCHNLKQEDWKKIVQLIFFDFNIKQKIKHENWLKGFKA